MGKKHKSQPTAAASALEENAGSTPAANGSIPSFPFFAGGGESAVAVDPMLASLFEKSVSSLITFVLPWKCINLILFYQKSTF